MIDKSFLVSMDAKSGKPVPKPRTVWTSDIEKPTPEPMPRNEQNAGHSTLKMYHSLKKQVNEGIDETRKSLRKFTNSLSVSSNKIDVEDDQYSSFYVDSFNKDFSEDFFNSLSFRSPLSNDDAVSCSNSSTYDSPRSLISAENEQDEGCSSEYGQIYPRKSTRSNSWSFYDSIYENVNRSHSSSVKRQVTQSTIIEFDPLMVNQSKIDESLIENEDIEMLEYLLKQGLNFVSTETPDPPKRVDSLHLFSETPTVANVSPDSKKKGWFQQILRKNSDVCLVSEQNTVFEKPSLNSMTLVHHKGLLFKYNGGKEFFQKFVPYWCVLSNTKFICYANITCENVKKNFDLTAIGSIEKGSVEKTNDGDIFLFNITLPNCFKKRYVFGASTVSRRRLWMQKLAESFTVVFPLKFLVNFTKIGWANTKNVINGSWSSTWLLLTNRLLLHQCQIDKYEIIDLRKARVINLQTESSNCNKNCNIFIDFQIGTIYFTMSSEYETKEWFQLISKSGCNNGANIDEQQLTKNDIPVVVEKCLNFIYANGLVSEGIYRRSGCETMINDLMEKFRNNAWDVTLTPSKQSEHDVASVLKRFLRELPEPLINDNDLIRFYEKNPINEEKAILFLQNILDKLPLISLKTLKRIVCHLNTVQRQCDKNLMTVENLAAIWGPTLIRFAKTGCDLSESSRLANLEIKIIHTLIANYEDIFLISKEELDHEKKIFQSLENYWRHSTNDLSQNSIKIWVYNLDKLTSVGIQINMNTNVLSACAELKRLIDDKKSAGKELVMEESIYDGKLTRLLHKDEKLFEVIVGWNDYFDVKTRKTNCLMISALETNFRYQTYLDEDNFNRKSPHFIELMMSSKNNKKFKKYQFELHNTFIKCTRDKNISYEWDLKSTKVYLGSLHNIPSDKHWFITLVGKVIGSNVKKEPFLSNSQCIWFTHESQYKTFINFLFQFYFFEEF